ncbi:MAG: MFS transporter [Candidatus Micrarchaeota archaeon]|nr:MFS transporter [Candidatus Micrarchaeota archaeon]
MEKDSLSYEERKKSMKYSIAEGMGYSVMSGFGEAYLPAAAVSLGASNLQIGMLTALPQLIGAAVQTASLEAFKLLRNRKLLVILGALLQALCWLPIIAVMVWPGELSVTAVIFFFALGTGAVMLSSPAWSSWIADIVPENERARFFAERNRIMQLVLFASTFAAGILIRELSLFMPAAAAFGFVFAIPFLSRLATVFFHMKIAHVNYDIQLIREIKLKHLFLLPAHRNELWFLAFIASMNFAVQFASPFFTPYMLNQLGFDLGMLGIMTALSIFAKIVSYPYWGNAIDRFGNRTVLLATATAVPLVPLLWLFSADPIWIGAFQIFSGFVWSGFDLASVNTALSLVGRELRPSFMSKYNMFSGFFNAFGAAAGGLFLSSFGGARVFGLEGILLVFLLSGAMRLLLVALFAPKILAAESSLQNTSQQRAIIFNLVAVYPTQGAVQQAMNGWDFSRRIVEKEVLLGKRVIKAGFDTTKKIIKKGRKKFGWLLGKRW